MAGAADEELLESADELMTEDDASLLLAPEDTPADVVLLLDVSEETLLALDSLPGAAEDTLLTLEVSWLLCWLEDCAWLELLLTSSDETADDTIEELLDPGPGMELLLDDLLPELPPPHADRSIPSITADTN